jgi:two-component sensor histidine kinase
MLKHLINIPLNPYFQALVCVVIIYFVFPTGQIKYKAEQVDVMRAFDKSQYIFADLDHDGRSERIQTFINTAGNAGVAITAENATLGQWNFKGIYQPETSRLMIGDYNKNGLDEIYIFTLVADSVVLHGLEYSKKPALFVHDRFIAKIGRNLKDPDYVIFPGGVTDENGDGFEDLVFSISSGFSRQPRNVFIYDLKNDTLRKSPASAVFISNIFLQDLDNDRYQEIILSTFAADNYNGDPYPYSDSSCWLMILDHTLNFMFQPVEFPGPIGSVEAAVLDKEHGEKSIMGNYHHGSITRKPGKIFLTDLKGKLIRQKDIEQNSALFTMNFLTPFKTNNSKVISGIAINAGFFEIDEMLNIKKVSNLKFPRSKYSVLDIDQDGHDEIIIPANGLQKHLILRDDFSSPVAIDFPVQSVVPVFSVKLNGNEPPQLSVQGDQDWKLFNYGINPVYHYRFLVWLALYLFILGFILLIRMLYSFQLRKKYETEQKITRLQLSGIKAQMEPHFIMNTINTIGSSIYRKKPEEAYKLLLNFSGMVRSLLVSSDKLTRTLEEEIEFVKNYLELEKSRFGDSFSFTITQADDVNPETVIPKMIIQMHAENALKHGIMPKKSGGNVDIEISRDQDYLVINISDNGIGRNAAGKKMSESTGKGMKILAQLFETYNKHNSKPLRQEITDLYDEDRNPSGTMVKIFVPLGFNEGIF